MPCRVIEDNFPEPTNEEKYAWEEERKVQERKVQEAYKEYIKSLPDNERIAFHSFMTVMLCKAMELVITNNLLQHTTVEMEWWYNEHKKRDKNNDNSNTNPEEVKSWLKRMENKYIIRKCK